VLDSPQHLQLHAALDLSSSLPFSSSTNFSDALPSAIFWLETDVVGDAVKQILKKNAACNDAQMSRLRDIESESWDIFIRILKDGTIVVTAVAVRLSYHIH
jgi:hypothetical protein